MFDSTLLDPGGQAFRQAPRDNLFAFYRAFARITNSQTAQTFTADGIYRFRTCLNIPMFNGMLVNRPPIGDETSLIDAACADFLEGGISKFSCYMVDDILTAAWDPVLRAQGFKFENQLPGMAMDLSRLPLLDLPAGLRIEPVRDHERLSTWVDTFILGYGVPVEMNAPFYRLMLALGLDGPVYNYLGWLDGLPVSVASLFSMDGIAGIYCVATVPAVRRRGLGAALTLHALYEGRAFGCTIGALQSSPMGFSVYERLRFQLTRRIEVYVKSLE